MSLFPKIIYHINLYRYARRQRRYPQKMEQYRQEILRYYAEALALDEDTQDVIDYLTVHPFNIFPYPWVANYNYREVQVYHDPSFNGLHYVLQDGKQLFFRRGRNDAKLPFDYTALRLEQDKDSPHRYLTDDFTVKEGDVVLDIGAAEGNFSLSVIEKASKVYLFEADPQWVEALRATFHPWKYKVIIVNKFVSDTDGDHTISLDAFLQKEEKVNFIKIDVEGAEQKVLQGASHLLARATDLKIALCTYHRQGDATEFKNLLEAQNFKVDFTKGYMIFINKEPSEFKPPYLGKGLLRAVKRR